MIRKLMNSFVNFEQFFFGITFKLILSSLKVINKI